MQVIYGINPLLEMLLSDPAMLEKIFIADGRGGEAVDRLRQLAADRGIPVAFTERQKLEKLAPRRAHQGVVALCRRHAYADVDDLLANRHGASPYDLIIILDSVTDPQNLGSIIRTAHCCGANGVVIPSNRAAPVTATVVKASAGAVYRMPTAMTVNLARTIDYLKTRGFWIYGADAASGISFHGPDYQGHVGLVLGSEGKGIRPLIRDKCDFLISIPMRGELASLNVSAAAGIILYEILRKWGKGA